MGVLSVEPKNFLIALTMATRMTHPMTTYNRNIPVSSYKYTYGVKVYVIIGIR